MIKCLIPLFGGTEVLMKSFRGLIAGSAAICSAMEGLDLAPRRPQSDIKAGL